VLSEKNGSASLVMSIYYSVVTKPVTPMSVTQSKAEIQTQIAGEQRYRRSAGKNHDCGVLTRAIRHGPNSFNNLFPLMHPLRASRKITGELMGDADWPGRRPALGTQVSFVHPPRIGSVSEHCGLVSGLRPDEKPKTVR
jgi:hypothetical protein